jgi:sirohydrochlorin cobaltochelatase
MTRALLLVGHGSARDLNASVPVREHAKRLAESGCFDEVGVGFWKEDPKLDVAAAQFAATDVTIVPVFISAGYYTEEVVPREMRLDGPVTSQDGRTLRYTQPIGSHDALTDVLVQRALEAGATPADAVAVLGHGTSRNPNSGRNVYEQAERLRARGCFAEIVTVFLDQEPSMARIFELATAERVVVVPLFIADGWHAGQTIPQELPAAPGQRSLVYAKAVGTHPKVADVILELARGATNG